MESEMAESQALLQKRSMKKKEAGGLHLGISEVSSYVTLVKGDKRVKGKQSKVSGRLSFQDYEMISQNEDRRLRTDASQASSFMKHLDVLRQQEQQVKSVDVGG